ncbi:MAG TPA: EF-hand domain-containing protein [Burkholderiales bacterium]|nr:EF-hand domain-containing protein [Burkholderiales bacterium]
MFKPALFVLILLVSAFALAEPADKTGEKKHQLEEQFKKADKDNDGTLTKEEAKAMPHVAKHFKEIDTDKDGTVSMDEIRAFMKSHIDDAHKRGEERFKKADKDNDGTLTKEEAKAMPNVYKNFDAIDTDKDGTVTLEEIHNFMKAKREEHKATKPQAN